MEHSERISGFLERYAARMAERLPQLRIEIKTPCGSPDDPGVPLVPAGPDAVAFDPRQAAALWADLLDALETNAAEAPPDLARLRALVEAGTLSPGAILRAALARAPAALGELAAEHEVAAPVLQFLGIYLARPFLAAARRGGEPAPGAGGSCATCGTRPALALLIPNPGRRFLWCRHCGARWKTARLGCPACGNGDADTLGSFSLENDPHRRVDFCRLCHGYIRTIDFRAESSAPSDPRIDLADLLSGVLDLAAAREGFVPLEEAAGAVNRDSVLGGIS